MPCTVAPDFSPEQPLVIGNTLALLPPDQWCHTVQAGETLAAIAAQYGVTPEQIYTLPWNQLASTPLTAVQQGDYQRSQYETLKGIATRAGIVPK